MTPILHSINFLQWLTELRITFFILDYWFMIKEYDSEQPDGSDAQGKVWGKNMEPLSPSPYMVTNPEAL